MDATTLLTADHNRLRGLFARFKDAKENEDLDEMTGLVTTILAELQVHTTIEEEIFYPALQDVNDEIHESITEGFEEHHVAKQSMQEISAMPPDTDEWAAKATVLIEVVEHHKTEEEETLFPLVHSATDADRREQLGERLEARKRELGAPTLADKIDLPKQALMELAQQQEIPGRSKMSQEELAATVAPP
jgi:hemerythrin superfamily protein